MRKIKSQPLSEEVRLEILNYIKTSFNDQSHKLPTEEQFANLLGVSRITIRAALNSLASEGIIFRRQGKGTFVNPAALLMKVPFNPVPLFYNAIISCGYQPDIKVLENEVTGADTHVASLLKINVGDPVVIVRKIFYADDKPCAYCEDYFPQKLLTKGKDIDSLSEFEKSIFDFLDNTCHLKVVWDKVDILATSNQVEPILSDYFDCHDVFKPFLLLDCVNYDENDQPVLYAKEYVDTSCIHFNSIRQKIYH